ncbi:hypothetical protein [Nostoc sp. CHAB 5715]|uniref:hypothetical protein n=1 Tax=Nostoc sp. CHAB 5715 TaxID=2780400 RepID=UPI001E359BA8|nr:hypothetical protein [Nostoc sp. CHAB 5715]MCC5622694.1 hypothetical protein [Nostoc sp. CHAB 5715]
MISGSMVKNLEEESGQGEKSIQNSKFKIQNSCIKELLPSGSSKNCLLFPNAQCPMPNAQCPMPYAQCPMPNAQCPMPNAQCPMPHSLL